MIVPMGDPLVITDFGALAARWIETRHTACAWAKRVRWRACALMSSAHLRLAETGAGEFFRAVDSERMAGGWTYIREYRLRRDLTRTSENGSKHGEEALVAAWARQPALLPGWDRPGVAGRLWSIPLTA